MEGLKESSTGWGQGAPDSRGPEPSPPPQCWAAAIRAQGWFLPVVVQLLPQLNQMYSHRKGLQSSGPSCKKTVMKPHVHEIKASRK